jgi:hypothetical protein
MTDLTERLRDHSRSEYGISSEAADEIDRLTAERDAATQASKWESDLCGQALEDRQASEAKYAAACDEIDRLRAEVAGLREDAQRYKYLRDVAWETGSLIFYAERYGPEDWDAHIDAELFARVAAP